MAVCGDGGGGSFASISRLSDSDGAVTWQENGWWVVVRRWETAQGAGGAYLAAFGVETTVMWHRKWATGGGNGVSGVAKILGAGCYSPGVPGLHPAGIRAHDCQC